MAAYKGRRHFSKEFKMETVQMIMDGTRSITDVCEDLGIHRNTVSRWIRQYRDHHADGLMVAGGDLHARALFESGGEEERARPDEGGA